MPGSLINNSFVRVDVKAVSSIHTQDERLDYFLRLAMSVEEGKVPTHIGEAKMERELKDCIMGVADAAIEPLVRFLPLILDEMVKLITRPPILMNQTGTYPLDDISILLEQYIH